MHSELQLALIVVGVVLMIGIIVDALRRRAEGPSHKKALESFGENEQVFESLSVNTIGAAEETAAPTKADEFRAEVQAKADAQLATDATEATSVASKRQIITLGIMALNEDGYGRKGFSGSALLASLRAAGLEFGEDKIFHAYGSAGKEGAPWFSVCAADETGTFELREITMMSFPSVIIYMTIPGPFELSEALDAYINTASRLANTLSAEVVDETGHPLTLNDLEVLKDRVLEPAV